MPVKNGKKKIAVRHPRAAPCGSTIHLLHGFRAMEEEFTEIHVIQTRGGSQEGIHPAACTCSRLGDLESSYTVPHTRSYRERTTLKKEHLLPQTESDSPMAYIGGLTKYLTFEAAFRPRLGPRITEKGV